MRIEIDQSGKIERLSHDTIIAASNDIQYSIKIPSRVKRNVYWQGKNISQIKYKLFCIGVYYCIIRYKFNTIIVDKEYQGKEDLIRFLLTTYMQNSYNNFDKHMIRFDNVGKNSNAHIVAINTFRGEQKPNEILTEREIWKLLK